MNNSKAKQNRVKELWLGLPETWRTEIASAWHTFIPVFFSTLYLFYETHSNTGVTWTKETLAAAIIAGLLAGLRAGFKAVSVWFFSRYLPDPKGTKSK